MDFVANNTQKKNYNRLKYYKTEKRRLNAVPF